MPAAARWLERCRRARLAAAFDTQVRGPFGKGAPEIGKLLEARGLPARRRAEGFVVKGSHGPLKEG